MSVAAKSTVKGYYSNFHRNTRRTLNKRANLASSRVVNDIRHALLSDELKLGDFLGRESDLVNHFGVGRVPMRDALRTLEAMGVVEIRVGGKGGVYIADSDPIIYTEVLVIQYKLLGISHNEMIDIQIAIENMALELAIKHATNDELESIADIVKELARYLDNKILFDHWSQKFHVAIAAASGNRAIISQMNVFLELLLKYFIPVAHSTNETKNFDPKSELLKHHRRLIKLLKERNTPAAHQEVRRHWNHIRKIYY